MGAIICSRRVNTIIDFKVVKAFAMLSGYLKAGVDQSPDIGS
jgi:hypothetical protein